MEDKIYETLIATGKFRSDESFAAQLAQEIEDVVRENMKVIPWLETQIAKRLIEEYIVDYIRSKHQNGELCTPDWHEVMDSVQDWLDREDS